MRKVNSDTVVQTAQTLVLVYSTVVAVHGIINYGKALGTWADEKFQKKTKNNLRIIKGGEQ